MSEAMERTGGKERKRVKRSLIERRMGRAPKNDSESMQHHRKFGRKTACTSSYILSRMFLQNYNTASNNQNKFLFQQSS